jgi:hypothetical protein
MIGMVLVGCSGGSGQRAPDAMPDAMPGSPSEGPNLLRNSDFEQLDGSGWVTDWENFDGNPDGQIVVVGMAHSGSHALQWQMDAAGDGREYFVRQQGLTPQQLRAGHSYALAGWYYVDAGGDVALNYIVRGEPGDTPDFSTVSEAPMFPTVVGQWAEFRFELTLPADATPQSWDVYLHSIKFNSAATKLTVDDVRLVELMP